MSNTDGTVIITTNETRPTITSYKVDVAECPECGAEAVQHCGRCATCHCCGWSVCSR